MASPRLPPRSKASAGLNRRAFYPNFAPAIRSGWGFCLILRPSQQFRQLGGCAPRCVGPLRNFDQARSNLAPNSLANLKAPSGADRDPLIVKVASQFGWSDGRAGEVIATS